MARRFLYPVDTDQFAHIRETGKVYVDKTDMFFDLVNTYQYVFLSRPRRFGKSLLCNTFKAYFQGRKDLFEGLKIMDLEKDWKNYPVLHFIMSGLKNVTVSEAKGKLEGFYLAGFIEAWGRGYSKIHDGFETAKLTQPTFEQVRGGVMATIRREKFMGIQGANAGNNVADIQHIIDDVAHDAAHDNRAKQIKQMMLLNPHITRKEIAMALQVSQKTIERDLAKMSNEAHYVGSGDKGHWEVKLEK